MRISRDESMKNESMMMDFFTKFGADVTLREANDELFIKTGKRMNLNRLVGIRRAAKIYLQTR